MIEASFATQYPQIDLFQEENNDMTVDRFMILLSGIMPDTPLGNIVQIRSESNSDTIKSFTPGQKRIRDEWLSRKRKEKYGSMSDDDKKKAIEEIQKAFAGMFA